MAYLIVWVVKVIIQLGHGFRYRAERLNDVAEDDGFPLQAFILVKTLRVYELHLLQDGRFPRLSSAYKLHMISTRVSQPGRHDQVCCTTKYGMPETIAATCQPLVCCVMSCMGRDAYLEAVA